MMYLTVGGILSFILGLIGILNFINAMITSISARQHEFAVLRSVGMTGGQLKKMIVSEGGLYAALSLAFALTAGNVICYWLVRAVSGQMWFFTYHFILSPLIWSAIALLLVSVTVPAVCYNRMCKKSIVACLRVSE